MSEVFNMVGGGGGPAASIFVTGLSETDTVTATNGSKTKTGVWTTKDSVSGWLFDKIKDYGTWTVTATDGARTITQDVLVDAITEYEIEMSYKLWLYKNGVEYEDVTGGWVGTESGYVYSPSKPLQSGVKNSDNMFCGNATSYDKVLGTNNKVDLTGYSKIYFTVKMTNSSLSNPWLAVLIDGKDIVDTNRFGEISNASAANVKTTRICDISGIAGEHYVAFACTASDGGGHCYEIWAE